MWNCQQPSRQTVRQNIHNFVIVKVSTYVFFLIVPFTAFGLYTLLLLSDNWTFHAIAKLNTSSRRREALKSCSRSTDNSSCKTRTVILTDDMTADISRWSYFYITAQYERKRTCRTTSVPRFNVELHQCLGSIQKYHYHVFVANSRRWWKIWAVFIAKSRTSNSTWTAKTVQRCQPSFFPTLATVNRSWQNTRWK